MASLGRHIKHGYQVRYDLYFPDGSKKRKYKYSHTKHIAKELHKDAVLLESRCLNSQLTQPEISYFLHKKLISKKEAIEIKGVAQSIDWSRLRQEYETYAEAKQGINTRVTTRSNLNNLEKYFKDKALSQITVSEILKYQGKRLNIDKAAPQTVRHERNVLNIMLDMAIEMGAISNNPGRSRLLKGSLKADQSRVPRALSYDEVKALLEAAQGNAQLLCGKIYLATLIFLFGGLRRGEALFLTRDDIKDDHIIIQGKEISDKETGDPEVLHSGLWTPKSKRSRIVQLPGNVANEINGLIGEGGRFIFGGKRTHHEDYLTKTFSEILTPINKDLTLHCLRHTFITWRIFRGDNIALVKEAAGHASIETTMRYTHVKVLTRDMLDLIK